MAVVRAVFLVISIIVVVWALQEPRFRDHEGYPLSSFCFALSAGAAFFLLFLFFRSDLKCFAFWSALGLMGQAAALQIIDAGKAVHYQHYLPLWKIRVDIHTLIILVQTGLVFGFLWKRRLAIGRWLTDHFQKWQLYAGAVVFILTSATLSPSVIVYFSELIFGAFLQLINLANVILIVRSLPQPKRDLIAERINGILNADRFVLIAALCVTTAAAILNLSSYQQHPHLKDETAYYVQARMLAHGLLSLPLPPVPEAFLFYLMESDGEKWYSVMLPGWPALLSVGMRAGIPWLVNPLLGGINVLLCYGMLLRVYDRQVARTSIALLSLSPWYVFLAMSFMSHMLVLTCLLIAANLLLAALQRSRSLHAGIAGIAAGYSTLVRPLDGVCMTVILLLWFLWRSAGRIRLLGASAFIIASVLIGLLMLPYNKFLTGEAMQHPVTRYMAKVFGENASRPGFGSDRGTGWPQDPFPGHGPLDALINANLNAFSINIELFGWSIGSILFFAVAFLSGMLRKRDLLLGAILVGVFIEYSFFFFSGGSDFGARYWFLMIIPLVVFSVHGIQFLIHRTGPATLLAVAVLSAFSLVNYFPWRAVDKYHHYLGMRPDVREMSSSNALGKSIVLIRGKSFPDYVSAAVYNPVPLDQNAPIYVWDRDVRTREQLLHQYRDREVWIIQGPSHTHRGYRIVAGPLSPDEAQKQIP